MSNQTTLLIDGHIHIYSHYDLEFAINRGINNLQNSAKKIAKTGKVIPIWLLTERYDCNFFDSYAGLKLKNFKIVPGAEKETLIVEKNGEPLLYIFAGRQLVTAENLEVLSLMTTLFLKDRQKSITEVIDHVIDSGGVPAINWAPGKWFLSRGKVVKQAIKNYSPENLLIGDTSLRTTIWLLPKLMAKAKNDGFKIIAGSDPLPFDNEEKQVGLYGFSITGKFDEAKPAESLRKLLLDKQTQINLIGKRNDLFTFGRRQFKIMRD